MGNKMFYIFECSTKPGLFSATDEPSGHKLPKDACPHSGTWTPQRELRESQGGFSADKAAAAIARQGFYLFEPTGDVGVTRP
jgi:hypothetical protein